MRLSLSCGRPRVLLVSRPSSLPDQSFSNTPFGALFVSSRRVTPASVSHLSSTLCTTSNRSRVAAANGIMAIIPDVPHVSVDIVVDGRPLPEYLDEDDDDSISPTSTIRYVECVSGSHFQIRSDLTGMELKHLKRGHAVTIDLYLDGKKVGGSVKQFPLRNHAVSTRSGVRYKEDGVWKERKFMFSNLVTCALHAFSFRMSSLTILQPRMAHPADRRPSLKDWAQLPSSFAMQW